MGGHAPGRSERRGGFLVGMVGRPDRLDGGAESHGQAYRGSDLRLAPPGFVDGDHRLRNAQTVGQSLLRQANLMAGLAESGSIWCHVLIISQKLSNP